MSNEEREKKSHSIDAQNLVSRISQMLVAGYSSEEIVDAVDPILYTVKKKIDLPNDLGELTKRITDMTVGGSSSEDISVLVEHLMKLIQDEKNKTALELIHKIIKDEIEMKNDVARRFLNAFNNFENRKPRIVNERD